ncbi:MAG: hypothetical protein GDA49_06370 [Rhodospirillales bacterium]|nr:hypothetical protein [Rhodospirillales bacterium]
MKAVGCQRSNGGPLPVCTTYAEIDVDKIEVIGYKKFATIGESHAMLLMVENAGDKIDAQKKLEASVKKHLTHDKGMQNIGYRGGNTPARVYADGQGTWWAAFGNLVDERIPRRWNVFGVFEPEKRAQDITVEINIPTTSNSAHVAGFFARDPATDKVYLMHDGGIGGGKPGVGKSAFLAWSKTTLEDVGCENGDDRAGIIIGPVNSDDLAGRIWRFVQLVKGFKDAVERGDLDAPDMQEAIAEWEESFKSEGSGRRRGRRRSEIDYISYHGDVVQRLYEERNADRADGEEVCNNGLIDLYVRKGQSMTEIYEVKTSTDRQSIYTAIGQLFSHSAEAGPGVKRTLVLPKGSIADDLEKSLTTLSIKLRRFSISSGKIKLRPLG